jgi:hypothetical protein
MAGFLYYFPDAPKPLTSRETAGHITECGLEPIFRDGSWPRVEVNAGPDNMKGQIVAIDPGPKGKAPACGYYPNDQEWREVKRVGYSTYWIGWMRDARPGPDDLARPRQLRGWPVRLADGNQWMVPVVYPSERATLPVGFHPNGDGQVHLMATGDIQIEEAERFYEIAIGDGQYMMSEAFVFCTKVLAINYRVGLYECSSATVGLVTSVELNPIMEEAFGTSRIAEQIAAQKKIANQPPDTSPTSVGDRA